jgi:hypothetical protein
MTSPWVVNAKLDKTQFVGHWVNWNNGCRVEQRLFANVKFRGSIFTEEHRVDAPDLYLHGPTKLTRLIEKEMKH